MFRFSFDETDTSSNLFRKWKTEVHDAAEVSQQLVMKIAKVYEKALVKDNDEGTIIDTELALMSTEFKAYLNAACEL